MTVPPGASAALLDTAFFRRWLDRATYVITREAGRLTELDSAIGDADHGVNLKRGFSSALAAVTAQPPTTPGLLLKAFGSTLTSTVGGASGPLYGTVLRRAARALGNDEIVRPETLGEALATAVAGVQRLGDSAPGDKTMVDALAPAAEAYTAALAGGAEVTQALAAAAQAARDGAEATIPLQARRGRASYLGARSIGHQDPGATSSALLITSLYEATDPELCRPAVQEARSPARAAASAVGAGAPGTGAEAGTGREGTGEEQPSPAAKASVVPETEPRVGVVLVSHSHQVAVATAELAKALVGSGSPAPIAPAGGTEDGGIGTSATLVRNAVKHVDAGRGVVVVCDMGSAVITVKALLTEAGPDVLPENVRIADAPFVEGAVGALVAASAGAALEMVLAAADDARDYHKL
jgi:dihydroxyacetone kinase phosphoprotein-dependent L subunit